MISMGYEKSGLLAEISVFSTESLPYVLVIPDLEAGRRWAGYPAGAEALDARLN